MSKQPNVGDKSGQGTSRFKIETKHTDRSLSKERSGFSDFMNRMYSRNRKKPKERRVRLSGINKAKAKGKLKRGLQRAETERKLAIEDEPDGDGQQMPVKSKARAKTGQAKTRGKSLHYRKGQRNAQKAKIKASAISQSYSKKIIKSQLNPKLRSSSKHNKYPKSYNINANVAKRLKIFEEKEPSVSDHLSIDGDVGRKPTHEAKPEVGGLRMNVVSPNRIVSGLQIQNLKARKQKPKRGKRTQKKPKRHEKNQGKSKTRVKDISTELASLAPGNVGREVLKKAKTKRQKTGRKKGHLVRSIEFDTLPIKDHSAQSRDAFGTMKIQARKTSHPKQFTDDMLRLSSMSEKQKLLKGSHVIDPVRSAGYNTLNFKDLKTTMSWLQSARGGPRKATRDSAHKSLSQSKIRFKLQKKFNISGDKGVSAKPKRVGKALEVSKKKNVSLTSKRYLQDKKGFDSRRSTTKDRMRKLVASRNKDKARKEKEDKKKRDKKKGRAKRGRHLEGTDKHKFEEMKKQFQKKFLTKKKGKRQKRGRAAETEPEHPLKIRNSDFLKEEIEERVQKLLELSPNDKKDPHELTKIIEKSYLTVNSENEDKDEDNGKKILFEEEKREKGEDEPGRGDQARSKIQRIRKRIAEQKRKMREESKRRQPRATKAETQKEADQAAKPERKKQAQRTKPKTRKKTQKQAPKQKESLSEKVIEKLLEWEGQDHHEDQARLIADSILHNVFKKSSVAKATDFKHLERSMQNIQTRMHVLEESDEPSLQARSFRDQLRKAPFLTVESKSTEKQSHLDDSGRMPISTKLITGENFLSKTEKSEMHSQPRNQPSLSDSRKATEEVTRSEGRKQPIRGETGSSGATKLSEKSKWKTRDKREQRVSGSGKRNMTQGEPKSRKKRDSKDNKFENTKSGKNERRKKAETKKSDRETSIDRGGWLGSGEITCRVGTERRHTPVGSY